MANRSDWYYRQKVLEDELEQSDTDLEAADQAIISDLGLGKDENNPAEYGGVCWGFDATNPSGLGILIDEGAGYDGNGRRCHTDANYTVQVSNAGDVAIGGGGTATGASTSPASGFERWVAIFLSYDRLLSDDRNDGYNDSIKFGRAESFHFSLASGTEKANGTLTIADKPARETGKILLVDVRVRNTGGVIAVYSFDQDREELFFRVAASGAPATTIARGRLREVLEDLLEFYNDHVGGRLDKHPAADITYAGGTTWADGTGGALGAALDVDAALRGGNADLKATTNPAGAKRIGALAQAGALATPSMVALSLSAGTLEAQLTALLAAINGRIFRGGDSGIGGALSPAVDGTDLGTATFSWDAFLKDLAVKGGINSNLTPGNDSTRDLGANALRWRALYVDDITMAGILQIESGGSLNVAGDVEVQDLTVHGTAVVEGAAELQETTIEVPGSGNGLTIIPTGVPVSGRPGKPIRIRSKISSAAAAIEIANLDVFGGGYLGPLFHDNFPYVSKTPSNDFYAHLPETKWEGIGGLGGRFIQIRGASHNRAVNVYHTPGQLGATVRIYAGMKWAVGLNRGLVGRFTCGFSDVVAPNQTGEYVLTGFWGVVTGFEATIRIYEQSAYAYFDNGYGTAVTGLVNLWSGAHQFYDLAAFRIVQQGVNAFYFEGPDGSEVLSPTTDQIAPTETCRAGFAHQVIAPAVTTGSGFAANSIWVTEQGVGA